MATNGRIAAIVPVLAEEGDTAGYLPLDAIKASRKGKQETAQFSANGVCKMADGQEFQRPTPGNYPNMDQVIPKTDTKFSVSLDPEILYALSQAIGSERGVTLEICDDGKAIRVRPCNNPRAESAKGKRVGFVPASIEALGLIMPIATT